MAFLEWFPLTSTESSPNTRTSETGPAERLCCADREKKDQKDAALPGLGPAIL